MKNLTRCAKTLSLCALSLLAAACDNNGSVPFFPITVGGSVSGLAPGATLQLQVDGDRAMTVTANGSFTLPQAMPIGALYIVTVFAQPAGQSCVVSNGSGTVGPRPVASVLVSCTTQDHTVGGTVTGLLGGRTLVLEDNGGNATPVSGNGSFSFATTVAGGSNYAVTVFTQPAGQTCSVTNGSGTIGASDVQDVEINCSDNKYNISVTVSGLAASGLTLQDNGASTLSISANGTYNFNTPVASGSGYSVTVASEPLGQSCAVTNGMGTVESSNVSNVAVTCVSNLYQIGGTLGGLLSGRSIVLQDNGGNSTTVSANGPFMFSTPVASGSTYSVTIFTQPVGQTCSVAMGSGVVAGTNVSSVTVTCSDNTYDIQVTASGLLRSGLTLENNGGDNLVIAVNGTYDFSVPVASGSAYAVTVSSSPAGESCSVSNGSGTVVGSTVTGITVSCAPNYYSIGGTVGGLLGGDSLVLRTMAATRRRCRATRPTPSRRRSRAVPVCRDHRHPAAWPELLREQRLGHRLELERDEREYHLHRQQLQRAGHRHRAPERQQRGAAGQRRRQPECIRERHVQLRDAGRQRICVCGNHPHRSRRRELQCLERLGHVASSNVTATVNCTPITYSIGGSVGGLLASRSIVLQDNGVNSTTVSSNTTFTFSTKVASGSSYAVSISTQPVGQTCTVTNGSGTVAASNVSNVIIDCTDNDYDIGVTVSSLTGTLVLQDNGGDNLTVTSSGTYTFATTVPSGSAYDVTVLTQPSGQLCTVTGPSGTVAGSNVNVPVHCVNTYTIGGTLAGLTSGSLVLQDNHGNNLTLSANGGFTFTTPLAQGAAYDVTILTQPTGQECTVSSGTGTVGAGNVTTVSIICAGAWTWMSGSNTQGAGGVYGTQGTASPSNVPGSRYASLTWTDASGNLWLFGGAGYDAQGHNVLFNDLWKYSSVSGWTWVSGSMSTNTSGVYGTQGTPAAGNVPGARSTPVSWADSAGNLWLFGGYGYDAAGTVGNLNDLWEFNPTSGLWTWVSGSTTGNAYGVYGTLGTASMSNVPGARNLAVSWTDGTGNLWLFGGNGQAQSGTGGQLNDLWMFNSTRAGRGCPGPMVSMPRAATARRARPPPAMCLARARPRALGSTHPTTCGYSAARATTRPGTSAT